MVTHVIRMREREREKKYLCVKLMNENKKTGKGFMLSIDYSQFYLCKQFG